jgi:hypothetical protein
MTPLGVCVAGQNRRGIGNPQSRVDRAPISLDLQLDAHTSTARRCGSEESGSPGPPRAGTTVSEAPSDEGGPTAAPTPAAASY